MKSKFVFRKDAVQTKSLEKAAKASAIDALRASKALGLTVTFIKDGFLFEEYPDGVKVKKHRVIEPKEAPFELTKGMVLHVK
jgi:hypothetical protein